MVPDHGRSYFSYLFPKTDSNYFHYSSCAALHGQLAISATAELLFINCSLSAHFSVPYKLATDNVRQSIKAVLNVDCLVHFIFFLFSCLQQESGGTVLSTNWKDIGKEKTECKPPDGMEFKNWEY